MKTDFERKFRVANDGWQKYLRDIVDIQQAYLSFEPEVRVRIIARLNGNSTAWLTVLGKRVNGVRPVYEYPIPVVDAHSMIENYRKGLIVKTRHTLRVGNRQWTIDEFHGNHAGLLLAETKVSDLSEEIELPSWLGQEVTEEPKYSNVNLAKE